MLRRYSGSPDSTRRPIPWHQVQDEEQKLLFLVQERSRPPDDQTQIYILDGKIKKHKICCQLRLARCVKAAAPGPHVVHHDKRGVQNQRPAVKTRLRLEGPEGSSPSDWSFLPF